MNGKRTSTIYKRAKKQKTENNNNINKGRNTVGCIEDSWEEAAEKCAPPITQHDRWVMDRVRHMYTTSFEQSVSSVDLSDFFQMELNQPHATPQVHHLCAPYAHYLFEAIGQNKIGLVPSDLLRVAFCQLMVLQAALRFTLHAEALTTYFRPHSSSSATVTLIDDFLVSFKDTVVRCKNAELTSTEVHVMHAMLALQHDSEEWIKDELGLLSALEHYELDECGNTRDFRISKVMDIVKSVERVVRVYGPLTLLSPLHHNPTLRQEDAQTIAHILYSRNT